MEPRILETQNDKGDTYKGFRLLIRQYSFSATISLVGSGSITFVLSADLDILKSTADCNNLVRRPTNFCVIFHHIPLLLFSSFPSSTWIHSVYLPVNTDPATLVGWICWTLHWFSYGHVVILNFV